MTNCALEVPPTITPQASHFLVSRSYDRQTEWRSAESPWRRGSGVPAWLSDMAVTAQALWPSPPPRSRDSGTRSALCQGLFSCQNKGVSLYWYLHQQEGSSGRPWLLHPVPPWEDFFPLQRPHTAMRSPTVPQGSLSGPQGASSSSTIHCHMLHPYPGLS